MEQELALGDQIGRGSYGSVYTATYGDRHVAVKAVPLEDSTEDDGLHKELQQEIKMLKECDSQWIVRYFGCLAKGRVLWIVMEHCEGGSVSDVRYDMSHAAAEQRVYGSHGGCRCCGARARPCLKTR